MSIRLKISYYKNMPFVYGIHAVKALLATHRDQVTALHVLAGASSHKQHTEILALAEERRIPVHNHSRKQLDQMQMGNHQGIIAECKQLPAYQENDLVDILHSLSKDGSTHNLFLILDGVQDPHNLGACLRTANAMGVLAVIAPKDRACSLNPTVRKVASGAAELTPFIQVTNLARTLKVLQDHNVWLVGLDMSAEQNLSEINFAGQVAIVVGGEGSGLRRLTKENCDFLAKIPMLGEIESLNVSVATGIALYEARRVAH